MKRKEFIQSTSIFSAGIMLLPKDLIFNKNESVESLYNLFKNPPLKYHPYVRWWWVGDKVERSEITRELELLKSAGIGGVEINPIEFPPYTDDLNKRSLTWLSDEWIDMLDHTLNETKRLGLTADLLVGSGWPFGAEFLEGDEREEMLTIAVKKFEGVQDINISIADIIEEADLKFGRSTEYLQYENMEVLLVPDPVSSLDNIINLSDQISSGNIKAKIPSHRWALYVLVKMTGFQKVAHGAPGSAGPVLNHLNKQAVEKYFNHMTDTIQNKIGPLKGRVRSFFIDSLELNGGNWNKEMPEEFKRRRGYDLGPYLPLVLFKAPRKGVPLDDNYGVKIADSFKDTIDKVRLDFDLTIIEVYRDNLSETFRKWCRKNGIQSRVQAYGNMYNTLDGNFGNDIPEGETWIKYRYGKVMPDDNYTDSRSYTVVNKYASSAAHLQGNRLVSCEECTNLEMIFNATLQMMKLCSDMSLITGITHSIWHGYTYSPPEAPFPGWIRFGNFISPHNTHWQYFKCINIYKARISALMQQADFFADIALFISQNELWTKYSLQNEPGPKYRYPEYISLVWEAIHRNGNACDYISESVIQSSEIKNGELIYGKRHYKIIFLISIEILHPDVAEKLLRFLESGGKIFCMGTFPNKSVGLLNSALNDAAVREKVGKMKAFKTDFIFLEIPDKDFTGWFKNIQQTYQIKPYVKLQGGNTFIQQIRYSNTEADFIFLFNSNYDNTYEQQTIIPDKTLIKNRKVYLWDANTGERFQLPDSEKWTIDLYPADLRIFVCAKGKEEPVFENYPDVKNSKAVETPWSLEFVHMNGGPVKKIKWNELKDLKDTAFVDFGGKIVYRNSFRGGHFNWLDLGIVHGISDVKVNGKEAGIRWYGRHIYSLKNFLTDNENEIEVTVTVVMGNYIKSLKDNISTQYRVEKQPIQSMGLIGPVHLI